MLFFSQERDHIFFTEFSEMSQEKNTKNKRLDIRKWKFSPRSFYTIISANMFEIHYFVSII